MPDARSPRPELDERLIGVGALAKRLNICPHTIYNWVTRSILPKPVKYGRLNRWRIRDINLWIAARHAAAKRRATENIDPARIAQMAIRSLNANPRGGGRRRKTDRLGA
jgi:predicted DNA-binding transcriptional regulator AlpA